MKNIKNYYKDYNVAELKEGLIALNLKFIEDKFFDKYAVLTAFLSFLQVSL